MMCIIYGKRYLIEMIACVPSAHLVGKTNKGLQRAVGTPRALATNKIHK
jgi:hypothetical protein